MEEKSCIRKEIRRRKRLFTADELAAQSRQLMERLLAHPRILSARVVLMYHALPDEVDTADALETLIGMGKKVLLPTVVSDEDMELCEYEGREQLHEGAFHIMESGGNSFKDYDSIDVAVVPGMAFDMKNNRLGRGKGYYDRFLAKIPSAYKLGVCFGFQFLESLPTGTFDIVMDEVLTGNDTSIRSL